MSPAPVTPETAQAIARKRYDRNFGAWAAGRDALVGHSPLLGIPLHPPTEQRALAATADAVAWVTSWSGVPYVAWGERRWASLGRQQVPERVLLPGPAELAAFCGRGQHWRQISVRCARLLERFPSPAGDLAAALARLAPKLAAFEDTDFERLFGVLDWLAAHPESGLHIRQLPIRGVDSKWVEKRRDLVERLHGAVTGRADLGLASRPDLVRLRFLDARLAPGGLADVAAPLDELASLPIAPRTVFVFENLETVLAVPPLEDAVVVHGSGYAVDRLARIPWVRAGGVLYWGDLDSHGFAILNRLRAQGLRVRTVLMDLETLDAYRDLWVPEPTPAAGEFQHLDPEERQVLDALAVQGNVRLEQERLDWALSLQALREAAS